jgi:hypothetical protein
VGKKLYRIEDYEFNRRKIYGKFVVCNFKEVLFCEFSNSADQDIKIINVLASFQRLA